MRLDPFTSAGISAIEGKSSTSWLPRGVKPVDILRAHPAQISLDGFYALNRPLLQVTVPPKDRRYPSSEDSSNNKNMSVVGESEFSEEQIRAGQHDPFAEEQIGQYDLHLVTEPDGADPEWAEGTDRHLASLEHNIPPPLPSPSNATLSSPTSSSAKKSSKKQSRRQEAIDFLFPIQAEARKAESEVREALLSSSLSRGDSSSSPIAQIEEMLSMEGYEVDVDGHHHHSSLPHGSGQQLDAMAGTKFLVNQLMKHRWSGMWEWEPTRRALVAASTPVTNAKGKAKASEPASSSTAPSSSPQEKQTTPSLQASLDKLSKVSRAKARAASRAERRGGALPRSSPANGEILTASSREDLQEMLARLARDPKSQGKTIFIQMPLDVPQSSNGKKKTAKKNKTMTEEQHVGAPSASEIVEGKKAQKMNDDASLLGEEEVKQVLEQVKKFQGFFDKSIDTELQSKAAARSSASSTSTSTSPSDVTVDAKLVGLEWDSPSSPSTFDMSSVEAKEDNGLSWYVEERPSEEVIHARHALLGSRMSNAQAYRGRSLRPTLRERLALRDVELVGPYKWIEMDSVKRKRRKRISKHKYKKRRKATRAERRRVGK